MFYDFLFQFIYGSSKALRVFHNFFSDRHIGKVCDIRKHQLPIELEGETDLATQAAYRAFFLQEIELIPASEFFFRREK